jgi:acetyl-CoA C-acetyltransferase
VSEDARDDVLKGDEVDEVIIGNILSAGLGQAPARQAAILSGLPHSVGAVTINKVCGSGLKAVMLAAQAIKAGDAGVIVAGGMESMSNSPYLLSKARRGYRMGHGELIDCMIHDGLWDPYNHFHMGSAAEPCAKKLGISREEQDLHAMTSYRRVLLARERGDFNSEMVSITQSDKGEETTLPEDEIPRTFHPIGASGSRILTTLLYALKTTGTKRGIAALCLGGGEAVAMLVENLA